MEKCTGESRARKRPAIKIASRETIVAAEKMIRVLEPGVIKRGPPAPCLSDPVKRTISGRTTLDVPERAKRRSGIGASENRYS